MTVMVAGKSLSRPLLELRWNADHHRQHHHDDDGRKKKKRQSESVTTAARARKG